MRVACSDVEIATAWLLERFPDGLEEQTLGGVVELAVFTDEAGEMVVRDAFSNVRSEPVAPGWDSRWKEFHRPVRAGGLWIGPPWSPAPPGDHTVVVDPGRAFGTGAHPTTQACIELLSRVERGSLLDAGCGSGVVAIAAVRLGFGPVHAVDLDEDAVEVATSTAWANGVEIDVCRLDVLRDDLPGTDVVVANIELAVVELLLGRLAAPVALTSGYLAFEAPVVSGWTRVDRFELDGWGADVLSRTALS